MVLLIVAVSALAVYAPGTVSAAGSSTTTTQTVPISSPSLSKSSPSTTPTTAAPSKPPAGDLPQTGFDAWLAALLGLGLVSLGFGVRFRFVLGYVRLLPHEEQWPHSIVFVHPRMSSAQVARSPRR
jgi:LPXTG-motif cell wall-anchored protein